MIMVNPHKNYPPSFLLLLLFLIFVVVVVTFTVVALDSSNGHVQIGECTIIWPNVATQQGKRRHAHVLCGACWLEYNSPCHIPPGILSTAASHEQAAGGMQ
jgi:hypothetical protein